MYGAIHPGSLALHRELSRASLNASAAVQTLTETPNQRGGYTSTYTTVITLPCRMGAPSNLTERLTAGREAEIGRTIVTFAAGTQINPSARLVVTWDDAGVERTVTLAIVGRADLRSNTAEAQYLCEAVR